MKHRPFIEVLFGTLLVLSLLWGMEAMGCQEVPDCAPLTPPESLYAPHGTVQCQVRD